MALYAVIKNGLVSNTVEADSENAMEVLQMLLTDFDEIIAVTEETKMPFVGEAYIDGKFMPIKPYPSWIFNNELWKYEAPIVYPDTSKPYNWSENTQSWEEVVLD